MLVCLRQMRLKKDQVPHYRLPVAEKRRKVSLRVSQVSLLVRYGGREKEKETMDVYLSVMLPQFLRARFCHTHRIMQHAV